jgi:hypothetical protein
VNSKAGHLKYSCILVVLICGQDNVEEQDADSDSEEDIDDTPLASPASEENDEDLMQCHKLTSEEANVHQFLVEQTGPHKTTASGISEIHNLSCFC